MALVLQGVDKAFDSTQAIEDVSFTAHDGEFLCLLGPNGSGKTTLLRLIAGLETVTAGSILLDGEPATESALGIGYVFQQNALFPWLTVAGNIAYGLALAQAPARQRAERVASYLERMALEGFADYFPKQLSGGMQQKVGIARALAVEPRVVLMDEPFAALDAQTRNRLQCDLIDVWQATGQTVVFVTHSVDEAVFLADRIIVLSERPARVEASVPVTLARPRDRTAAEFNEIRRHVLGVLGHLDDGAGWLPPRDTRTWADIPEIL